MKNNTKTMKTVLFASLIAAMILPLNGMQIAEAEVDEKQKKIDKITKELKNTYKDLKKSHHTNVEKLEYYKDLKKEGIAMIKEYHPNANPIGLTEDEYFEMLENKKQSNDVSDVSDVTGESRIQFITHSSGTGTAKLGYDHPCPLIPIFVCNTLVGSAKTVSTSDNGVSFIGYTQEYNSWILPMFHFAGNTTGKYYYGDLELTVDEPSAPPYDYPTLNWTHYKQYFWTEVDIKPASTYPSGCTCGVDNNTVINGEFNLEYMH